MARVLASGLAICLMASVGSAQVDPQQQPDSRTVLGGGNELLAAGAEMIRAGQYEDGIRLTTLGERNWRAYSNRSYAFYLKGMYAQANADLEAAASISPNARQVMQIRGMINERNLRPSVIMEDHR
jgi:hypothetical protein